MVARLSSYCSEVIRYQRGVVARWQLANCPADLAAIDVLLRRGRWQTLYRGVYAAYTGESPRESTLWAAVRRCGPEAALSHFTAAELDGVMDRRSDAVHVTIPAHRRVWLADQEFNRGLPRIVLHRSTRLPAARHPARTPPRTRVKETVLDLAELADGIEVAFGWLSAACNRRLVTPGQLRTAAARRAKMRWRTDVLAALDEVADGVHSALERGYVLNVERPHRLPKPKRQKQMKRDATSAYLDNFSAEYEVAVELDGLAAHPVEARWRDIHRDNYLARSGIITLRYNWADITRTPCQVAAVIMKGQQPEARRGRSGRGLARARLAAER